MNAALILSKDAQIDWLGYAGICASVGVPILIGLYYRHSGRSERIASTLICTGGFILFSACLSLFNYLLLPLRNPVIDVPIAEIDAWFGYHWPAVMEFAASHPIPTFILKLAYMTTIPQITLLVVILGLSGRIRDLHVMITIVIFTATLTICFWGLFPTLGAKSMYVLPQEIWAAVNPVVNEAYTKYLLDIAVNGPGIITPNEIRGLIAFPSYHAVLAFIAMYAGRNLPYLRWVFFILNLLILPATFIHGGHHMIDFLGGFAMFALGVIVARSAVKRDYEHLNLPAIASA